MPELSEVVYDQKQTNHKQQIFMRGRSGVAYPVTDE